MVRRKGSRLSLARVRPVSVPVPSCALEHSLNASTFVQLFYARSRLTQTNGRPQPGAALTHAVPSTPGARKAYVHVTQTSGYNAAAATGAEIKLSGAGAAVMLCEGDGAYVTVEPGAQLTVENVGGVSAEMLLFDVDV
jgi:hypothetical protein